jgi:four helix bundle protein
MTTGIKELKLWQEAVALGADAARLARGATRRETKTLVDRLLLAAADVAARIAAGYTQDRPTAQRDHYLAARTALVEVETLLTICRQAALVPADAALAAGARAGGVHRLLAGYLAFVDRQVDGAGASSDSSGRSPPG